MHKEIKIYVDDMIAKSKTEEEHLVNLRKLFKRLQKYQLRLLGFVVSHKGIEVDPKNVKVVLEMTKLCTEKQVQGFLGHQNYISRFIS